jgi:hypothetical protein
MSKILTRKGKAEMEARLGKPVTMSIPEGGWKYFGIGRMASYAAAKRGDLEVMEVGGLKRVITAAMDAKMARLTDVALEKLRTPKTTRLTKNKSQPQSCSAVGKNLSSAASTNTRQIGKYVK